MTTICIASLLGLEAVKIYLCAKAWRLLMEKKK